MYTEQDLIKIAKRENNKKRPYLIVNKLQAKHIPTAPSQAFKMFDALEIGRASCRERVYVSV